MFESTCFCNQELGTNIFAKDIRIRSSGKRNCEKIRTLRGICRARSGFAQCRRKVRARFDLPKVFGRYDGSLKDSV